MTLSPTGRTRHSRLKENGRTDRADLFEVLRAGFVCHLGMIVDGTPMVVPTVYGFDASSLYFHALPLGSYRWAGVIPVSLA